MALTKVTGQVIKNTTDVTVGVLTVTNTLAVGGTVSIGGTLTYEDVTNVDAVGLITARDGIKVGSGITLSVDGDIFATGISTVKGIHVNGTQLGEDLKVGTGVTITRDGDGFFTGIVTATTFKGDGSQLSNITSTTINNNADNRLITGSGTANTLNGESGLTFSSDRLILTNTSTPQIRINNDTSDGSGTRFVFGKATANNNFFNGAVAGDSCIGFASTLAFAVGTSEKVRITSDGEIGVGINNPARILHLHQASSDTVQLHITNSTTGTTGSDGISFALGSDESLIINQRESNHIALKTADTERVRITSSGQLLVGTTSVTGISGDGDDLVIGSIDDSTNRGITLATTGQAAIRWADAGDNAMGRVQYSNSTDKMNFYTSNAERFTILSDGKIGINDSSPSRRLEITEASDTGYVINTATVNNCLMLTNPQTGSTKNIGISFSGGYSNGEGYITMVGDGGTGGDFRFALRSGGSRTDRMTITNDSTINGDFNDTSDINLKENIASIPSSIDKVKQLRPVTFDWKESYRPNNVSGFIAQEVKTIYPDLVRGVEWTAEDPGKHYTINTMGVVAHLTKALQESITKIEALEAEVAALKSS